MIDWRSQKAGPVRGRRATAPAAMAILCVLVACSTAGPLERSDATNTSIPRVDHPRDPARVMQMWRASCALCHVDGTGGAPISGSATDWRTRLAQGREALLANTINGINGMPPLGYCMACEREDFASMIEFMTQGIDRGEPGT